jgi:hypothetical protein
MRLRFMRLSTAILLFFPSTVAGSDLSFSRNANLGPVQLSYNDLYAIVEKIRDAASVFPDGAFLEEDLDIATSDTSRRLQSGFTKQELSGSPMPAYSISIPLNFMARSASDSLEPLCGWTMIGGL